jgi:hypothetical protein
MKKMKRIMSAAMVLLLMATLPVNAFAAEWYMEDGDITVNAGSSGQTVTQGTNVDVPDAAPVITQKDSSTATTNTVTINAESGATAEVTLSGVNIINFNAAVSTSGEGGVTIELDNSNTVESGGCNAGLEKNNAGELAITDEDSDGGSLYAQGGKYGAGIGGGDGKDGSNITISGGKISAVGGNSAAGIGGGGGGEGSNINIWDEAQVKAQGGAEEKKAYGYDGYGYGDGAAIGNGGKWHSYAEDDEYIDYRPLYIGEEITPNTSELTNDGKIEYYALGADMNSSTPTKTVTGTHEHNWNNGEITKEATCMETGVMTYTCAAGNDFTKTEEIAATGNHNIVIDPAVAATCTSTGLTAGQHCTTCTTQTVEQQEVAKLEHNIVIDPAVAPTYTSTGLTEGSHCTTCDTMTVKQEIIPKLERPADTDTQSAPLYRVTDKDGKNISYKAEQKDGVLTITVDADFAILTGTLSGINTLKARGTEKIVFVTKDATSTFTLADLLEKGSMGDTYKLTHDGADITFTLGAKNTDVSDILEKA